MRQNQIQYAPGQQQTPRVRNLLRVGLRRGARFAAAGRVPILPVRDLPKARTGTSPQIQWPAIAAKLVYGAWWREALETPKTVLA